MEGLSRAERETIIRRSDDERHWDIYSASPRDINRIKRMVKAFDGELTELPGGDIRAKVPINAITFRAAKSQSTGGFTKQGRDSDVSTP